ncbi:MAG: signal recognition particle-docking protein FtsY [Sulfolobales archaeon]|nr:signal recognition particle-docking protein FtsY [Sulfolobales archaeon]
MSKLKGSEEQEPQQVEKGRAEPSAESPKREDRASPSQVEREIERTAQPETKAPAESATEIVKTEKEKPETAAQVAREKQDVKGEEKEEKRFGFFDFLRYKTIKEEDLNDLLEELKLELVESDVSFDVTQKIADDLAKALRGRKVARSQDIEEIVRETLKKSINEVMTKNYRKFDLIDEIKKSPRPYVIVFFGVNGVGKTTTIAKFAYFLKKNGLKPIIAASDTFRAAAQEQLAYHATKLEVPIVKGKYGGDPAAVAVDAINAAKSRGLDVVLVDTAGRMHVDADLVEELRKTIRVTKPNLRLLIIDSLAGSDALEQAKVFNEKVGYDGVVLTKIDADVKGGIALSLAYELEKPVLFLGVGQGYEDLIPFDPEWFVKRLLE